MSNLQRRILTTLSSPAQVGSATFVSSNMLEILDMSGFEGIRAVASIGASTQPVTLQIWGSDTTTAASMAQLAMNSTGVTAATTVQNIGLVVDIYRPGKRFVSATLNSTAAGNIVSVTVDRYGAHICPTTHSTAEFVAEFIGNNTT